MTSAEPTSPTTTQSTKTTEATSTTMEAVVLETTTLKKDDEQERYIHMNDHMIKKCASYGTFYTDRSTEVTEESRVFLKKLIKLIKHNFISGFSFCAHH